jgi:hypothetical protein
MFNASEKRGTKYTISYSGLKHFEGQYSIMIDLMALR